MNYINDNNCRYCTYYKCRCADCFALIEKDGKWYCDECENYCENIIECDEFEDCDNEDCDAEYRATLEL